MKSHTVVALGAGVLMLGSGCAASQESVADYPSRAVSVIVPVPAGSSTDLSTRLVTPCLQDELGQSVVVENRDGGSGAVGNGQFVRAKADGYTLVSTTAANAVLPELVKGGVGFDAESFKPIGLMGQAPIVLVVKADSGLDVDNVLKGDNVKLGVTGSTGVPGLVARSLVEDHGATVTVVPFDASGDLMNALIAGEVPAAILSADIGVTRPRIDDGTVKAIATAVSEPVPSLPGVPTLASLGYPNLPLADSFWFLAAQPDTPAEIVGKLDAALRACMVNETVVDSLGAAAPDGFVDGDQVATMLKEAQDGYAKVLAER